VPELIYSALMSLDGYSKDEQGSFDWAAPDVELHQYVNDLERSIGTHVYGRRMYETMAVWQDIDEGPGVSPIEVDFARQWRALDKVVHSRTLDEVWTPRTRLVREFDPDALVDLVARADHDVSISGPTLAQHAFSAGVIDVVHLFVFPISVGGGTAAMPHGQRHDLHLVDERRFDGGVVHLHLRAR
jgi:dihydrofolate reductase